MAPNSQTDALSGFIDTLVNEIALRLQARIGALSSTAKPAAALPAKGDKADKAAPAKRRSNRAGKKLDMACRAPGCKNRSKGPRYHFLCDEHLKPTSAPVEALAMEPSVTVPAKPVAVTVQAKRTAKVKAARKTVVKVAAPAKSASKSEAKAAAKSA